YRKERLPHKFNIVGAARTEQDDDAFRNEVREGAKQFADLDLKEDEWNEFAQHLHYCAGDFTKDDAEHALKPVLEKLEGGPANRLFYLATPPQFFVGIIAA
ncbi:MAG: glucose-6-phosphate dehydrogenase, partial [Candidatus Velthaea sp.]